MIGPARLLAACIVAFGAAAGSAAAETIAVSCGAVGLELKLCQEGADAWAKKTGNEVKVISTPNSATERLALYQQLLAAKSPDIDVFQIDVIWPGILANHFIDLTGKIPADEVRPAFQGDRREQHGRRQAGRDALVHRCRHAVLPQGPAGGGRQAGAADLAGADRRSPPSCRTRRARPATTGCGASSSRARPMRA